MQAFNSELFMTTSEVADLLGVHSSTVKRWTDAAELDSHKTDGGHRRIYLQAVLEFARAREVGTFLDAFEPFESHVWLAARDAIRHDDFKKTVTLAMGWLVRGHPKRITALFHELGSRTDLPFSVLCDRAIQPFMAEVGDLWREGRLRIGEEHMASQAVLEALIHLSARRDTAAPMVRQEDRRRAIVGAMAGDQHHLGAMCVRILLERNGWDVQYLGADTPAEEFAALQRSREAELVCVSFSPPASVAHMRRCLDVMSEFYRSEVPYHLAFGGLSSPLIEAEAVNGPWETFQIHPSAEAFERWLNEGVSGVKSEPWRESA